MEDTRRQLQLLGEDLRKKRAEKRGNEGAIEVAILRDIYYALGAIKQEGVSHTNAAGRYYLSRMVNHVADALSNRGFDWEKEAYDKITKEASYELEAVEDELRRVRRELGNRGGE